eukprot:267259_1
MEPVVEKSVCEIAHAIESANGGGPSANGDVNANGGANDGANANSTGGANPNGGANPTGGANVSSSGGANVSSSGGANADSSGRVNVRASFQKVCQVHLDSGAALECRLDFLSHSTGLIAGRRWTPEHRRRGSGR